jgi:hypothetical protein
MTLVLSSQPFCKNATKLLGLLGSSLVEAWTSRARSKLLCTCNIHLSFSVLSDVGDRCSVGKTMDGRKFQETHSDWLPGFISPWYEFLRQRHRKFDILYYVHKLIGVLAIEERHRRASLWAQPSTSVTDAAPQPQSSHAVANPQLQTNPETVPSPHPQSSPEDPLVADQANTAAVASPQQLPQTQCSPAVLSVGNPALVGSQSPTTVRASHHPFNNH